MALGLTITIEQRKGNALIVGNNAAFGSVKEEIENVRDVLLSTALQVLKEEQRDGFDKSPRVRVDNKFNKGLFDVNPFGKIEFFARQSPIKILANVYSEIQKRSPVVSGQFKASNYVFHNTRLVARTRSEFVAFIKARREIGFSEKDVFRFINVTPYARKLERFGVSKGRQKQRFRKSHKKRVGVAGIARVPNGAYSLAIRAIRRQSKGAFAAAKFMFHKNGAKGIHVQSGGGFRNTFKKTGQPYLYPMIVLSFSPDGVLS